MATTEAKVALVTGSSSGIGESVVKLLSQKGYKIAVCGSNKEKVDRVVADCHKLSPQNFQPLAVVLDFSVPTNGQLAVRQTIDHFGRLDVLVNNAGIFKRVPEGSPSAAYEAYKHLMSVNIDATVSATLEAVEELKRTNGNIVFVSSVASVKPSEKGYSYCMSKAAMSIFAKCLAIDLAPHVRVNIVSPGPIKTPIFSRSGSVGLPEELVDSLMRNTTLQNRVGLPEEVADSVYFLISNQASFVNGHELFIDGGYLLKPSSNAASQQIINAREASKANNG